MVKLKKQEREEIVSYNFDFTNKKRPKITITKTQVIHLPPILKTVLRKIKIPKVRPPMGKSSLIKSKDKCIHCNRRFKTYGIFLFGLCPDCTKKEAEFLESPAGRLTHVKP